jgi:cytochrome c biogenesis protein
VATNEEKPITGAGVYDYLASTRLAIQLLIGITIACIAGVLLPQKFVTLNVQDYQVLVQQPIWHWLDRFGFLNIFKSVWFLSLLGLMLLNLALCTARGLKRTIKRIKSNKRPITERTAGAGAFKRVWDKKDVSPEKLEAALSKLGRPVRESGEDGSTTFRVAKSAWVLYSPYVIHLSIFLLVIGAVIDVFVGLDGTMNIPEGSAVDQFQIVAGDGSLKKYRLPFSVRCEDFEIETYEGSSRTKDYKSTLTVVENGQDRLTKTIEVNSPLQWGGIRFFQSSYGTLRSRTKLTVTRRADGMRHEIFLTAGRKTPVAPFANEYQPPDTGETVPPLKWIQAVETHPDMMKHGPAARIAISRGDQAVAPFVIFQNSPDFDDMRNGPYKFALKSNEQEYYTGIMVVRKPGVPLIWAGCALFMIAITIGFAVPYRRAWIWSKDGTVVLGGTANRSKDGWMSRLDDLTKQMEPLLGKPKKKDKR